MVYHMCDSSLTQKNLLSSVVLNAAQCSWLKVSDRGVDGRLQWVGFNGRHREVDWRIYRIIIYSGLLIHREIVFLSLVSLVHTNGTTPTTSGRVDQRKLCGLCVAPLSHMLSVYCVPQDMRGKQVFHSFKMSIAEFFTSGLFKLYS